MQVKQKVWDECVGMSGPAFLADIQSGSNLLIQII